jgi:cytochrome c biogenesis protein CcmG/thiol:disulfide interchange protein DsbE
VTPRPTSPTAHRPVSRRGRRPLLALAIASIASVALTACGGDDEPTAAPDDSAPVAPVDTRPPVDGPRSTLSPDIPDTYAGQVAPVDVTGTPLPPLTDAGADAAIGQPAPVLVGLDPEGRPIRIDPAADGPTMLVFVAHWCPHCNEEIPKLNEMRADGRFPADLDIVAVSTAVAPDRPNWPPVEWLRDDMDWRDPAMLDQLDVVQDRVTFVAADAYGLTGFPFTVLVDGDGTVADRWSGRRDPDEILTRLAAIT